MDLHQSYKAQIDTAHERIKYLELKLQDQEPHLLDHDLIRKHLYESERNRTLETSARICLQRHLKVEQAKTLEVTQKMGNLRERIAQMEVDHASLLAHFLDTTFAMTRFNYILLNDINELQHEVMHSKEEITHNQRIINSLAMKISLYDSNSERVLNNSLLNKGVETGLSILEKNRD